MPPPYSGREIAKVPIAMNYQPVGRTGSHLKLRYFHPETDEVRNVTVPLGGEISTGTLRSIAGQCGADSFEAWRDWIDDHR